MTDAEAEKPTNAKGRRKPSTGFPVVSLAEASKILKDAGRYGFDHSVEEFASYMGHTTTNSGAFRQRLAAFREWKLIAGRGDTVSMTQIGRVIALPADDESEQAALQEAFRGCVVFSKLYDESRKGTPLDRQGVGRRAIHAFGVSPNSVNKFVESFVESAVVAALADETGNGQVVLVEASSEEESVEGLIATEPTAARTTTQRPSSPQRSGTPVVHQAWPIADGMIVFEIRSEKPLPAAAYATVGEVVASLERLAAILAGPATSDPASENAD